jgi:hypothetical protein
VSNYCAKRKQRSTMGWLEWDFLLYEGLHH